MVVTRFGWFVSGAVLDHQHVSGGAGAEDEDEGPDFETTGGSVRRARSAGDVRSNGWVGLKSGGEQGSR